MIDILRCLAKSALAGRESVGGARRAPARAVSWILSCRQRKPRRQGKYPHAELQGASNRPTRSSMHLSEATTQTAAKIPSHHTTRASARNLLIVGWGALPIATSFAIAKAKLQTQSVAKPGSRREDERPN